LTLLYQDFKSCNVKALCKHLYNTIGLIFSGYKALLFIFACSIFVFFQSDIQDWMKKQKDKATEGFGGQLPFIAVGILVIIIKSLSGPASKSIITFCVTIIYHVNGVKEKMSDTSFFTLCFLTDWFIDIFMSVTQVHFAAAKFSRSLFLLLRIWITVVNIIHPAAFLGMIVFQASVYFPPGDGTSSGGNSFINRTLWAFPFVIWSIIHIIHKLSPNGIPWIKSHNDFLEKYFIIVPARYVEDTERVLGQWSMIFSRYQAQNMSVLHAILRLMKVSPSCLWYFRYNKEGLADAKKSEVKDIWDNQQHAVWMALVPAWLWVYTAEFVLLLDAIFLVPFVWNRYYGVIMIGLVTLADFDRFFTIMFTIDWLEGEDFEDTVTELIWFKIIKQPIGQLFGVMHVMLMFNDFVREALYGPHLEDNYKEKRAKSSLNGDCENSYSELSAKSDQPSFQMVVSNVEVDASQGGTNLQEEPEQASTPGTAPI